MAIPAQLYQENLGFPLFGSQDIVEGQNGCGGFSQFGLGIQQRVQLQYHHGPGFQSLPTSEDSVEKGLVERKMADPQGVATVIDRQSQEIQQFLLLQNESLRLALQEERRLQMVALVKRLESRAQALLLQKDQEMARASQRAAELEELLRKLEFESQAWQRIAQENEAMVASLKIALEQQLREKASWGGSNEGDGAAEDAESYCCGADRDGTGTEEEVQGQERRTTTAMTMACRACNSRGSCMLFLPCRHLCSCKACEGFLHRCPLCATAKEGTVEALL